MSPAYMQCPACGKRALSVATRCPGCGIEFPRGARPRSGEPGLGRLLPVIALAAAAALAVVSVRMLRRGHAEPSVAQAPAAAAPEFDTAMAASPPAARGERRFARTWTNVRNRRSPRADVVGVLLPGDTVLADSLARGWWRISFEGQVIGYVSQSTLDTVALSGPVVP